MKAAMYYGQGRIEIVDLPRPTISDGELLVRVDACGLCGSDLMQWYQDQRAPTVLGHEPVGEVVEAGRGASIPVGSRVFVHHHVPCMECALCLRGRDTLCPQFRATSIAPGGLAEFIRVPAVNAAADVLILPDTLSTRAATLIEPLACVIRGLRLAGVSADDRVVVVGAGAMGLLEVGALVARGVEVIVVEPRSDRRRRAQQMGARVCQDGSFEATRAALGVDGARVVVVTTTSAAAIAMSLTLAGPAGVVQLFAPPSPGHTIPLDLGAVWFREVRIESSYSAGPMDTREALDMLTGNFIDPDIIISHQIPLAQIDQAFALARSLDAMKVIVQCSSTE